MSILAHISTPIKLTIPDDVTAYRAWVQSLDEHSRLLLFGVSPDAVTFRCPTNGRIYADDAPLLQDGAIWTKCYWCDTAGRVRGRDRDFDRASGQPHPNPLLKIENI